MNLSIFRGAAPGEVAVVGLGRSGRAAAELLVRDGHAVYASDGGASDGARRAADDLRTLGAAVEVGGHDLERIARAALVVASPGVPPEAPPLVAARRDGREPVVSEIEIALRYLPSLRYMAVTGTNGKTTTTALVGHLLRALGHDAADAGNIGTPLASLALRDQPPPWVALELSSFQLHDTPSVAPTVGVLTNLSPDHLDRYASVAEYYADKARLFANADTHSRLVVNADDHAVMEMVRRRPGLHWHFSARGDDAEARYDRRSGRLVLLGRPLLDRADFPLIGDHNVANALAAALAVTMADPAHQSAEAQTDHRRGAAQLQRAAAPHGTGR